MNTEPRGTLKALERHFADLRDGDHFGETTRQGKERAFERAILHLESPVRQALGEINATLLLGTGRTEGTGPFRDPSGGLVSSWLLSWPEQRDVGLAPISVIATYGARFHHPHIRGATVGEWPLNVDSDAQALELLPIIRSIAAGDIHNLVFQTGGNWRIIPATARRRVAGVAEHG
ncbi:hypothetical protein D9V32_03810 [Mycetocola tolaasinivorans]|uniref:Uncharacterized protein n=1 Tax=Mycetocola tolaasinivorans TaxID=76635 RepID=A0A3L7AAC6_9MICO|nr:hypothetical protein [Mycetocola tolaasinivorans]RLP76778.1 hypothetical protein D9V32_03810 [Mycetocola tolaasinivorans]